MLKELNDHTKIKILIALPIMATLSLIPALIMGWTISQNVSFLPIVSLILVSSLLLVGLYFWLESSLRKAIAQKLLFLLSNRNNEFEQLDKIESVNYTSAIEKFTWSLVDIVKYGSITLGSLAILLLSDWVVFMLASAIILLFYVFLKHFTPRIINVRKNLEKSAKNMVYVLSKNAKKSNYFSIKNVRQEIKSDFGECLSGYAKHRTNMTIYRFLIGLFSLLFASILLVSGVFAMSYSVTIGIIVITLWSFYRDHLEKLVDAYIVNLGEVIHIDKLYHANLRRSKLLDINIDQLRCLNKKSSALLIDGPNGSGKSVLLQEIYYAAPDQVTLYDAQFSLSQKTAIAIVEQGNKTNEIIIFDEAIKPKEIPGFFTALEEIRPFIEKQGRQILIAAHNISDDQLGKLVKKISIGEITASVSL